MSCGSGGGVVGAGCGLGAWSWSECRACDGVPGKGSVPENRSVSGIALVCLHKDMLLLLLLQVD